MSLFKFADEPVLIEIVGGDSSFWNSSFFGGLLALSGVIVAGLFGFVIDWRKQKRVEEIRWDNDVRQLSSKVFFSAECIYRERVKEAKRTWGASACKGIDNRCSAHLQTLIDSSAQLQLITPDSLCVKFQSLTVAILICEQDKTTSTNFPAQSLVQTRTAVRSHLGVTTSEETR